MMKLLKDSAIVLALLAFTVPCVFAMVTIQSLRTIPDDVHALVLPTQKMEARWAAAGLTAAQTLAKERDAFTAHEAGYEAFSAHMNKALDAVRAMVNHGDGAVLKLTNTAKTTSQAVSDTAVEARKALQGAMGTLQAGSEALNELREAPLRLMGL